MKTKNLKILIIGIVLSFVACLVGFVSLPKKSIAVAATGETPTFTNYMLESGIPTKKESMSSKAGSLTINGTEVDGGSYKFVLGQSNIELVASANQGFVLKGWYILYEDNTSVPGTTNGYVAITDENQLINNNYISVNSFSVQNKSATLTIITVSDNIKIAPVFDYEYYKATFIGVNGEKEIINSSVKYGDVVQFEKVIEGVNIDALNVTSSQINFKDKFTFTKDQTTGKTTNVNLSFTMSVYEDVEIELVYDNLYRVDLKLFLQGSELADTTSQQFIDIFSCVSLTSDKVASQTYERYFKKLSNTSYFVKNGANFEISALQNFKNASGYVLYNFESIDKSTSKRTANLNNISADKIVEIKYVHNEFKVEFVGVDYLSDKTVQVNNKISVPDAKALTIVSEPLTLNDDLLKTNVGYTFVGFAKYVKGKSTYVNADFINTVSLDGNAPEDTLIYLLYTKTQYTINLTGLTDVQLMNTSNQLVYPVLSAKIGNDTKTGTNISFSGFELGDEISLELTLNAGFDVTAISGMTKGEGQIYTLILDDEFLSGKDETINLAITAEKLKYTLTYKIAKFTEAIPSMADIWVEGNETIETLDSDKLYYEIVVGDLTYYQTLTLKSKQNSTGTTGEYFIFKWFTTDFKTILSEGLSYEGSNQLTHSIPVTIYGDSTVYVVYSQPKTQMRIEINSAPANAGITFAVVQKGCAVTADNNGFYELTKGINEDDKVNITITGLVDNVNLFGYRFINTELYTTLDSVTFSKITGSESESATEYSFIPTSSNLNEVYVVRINIQTINYIFNIKSNTAFETSKTLTIEDADLEFDKILGNYVKRVEFKKLDGSYEEYSVMNQDNSSRNGQVVNGKNYFSVYYYKISTIKPNKDTQSEFEMLIEKFAKPEGSNYVLDILITFEVYQYDVNVKYVKFNNNALDTSTGNKLVYPTIQLSYKLTNNAEEEPIIASYENLSSEIKFKYIPYGANISLKVVRGVSAGFEMMGWYDYDASYKIVSDAVQEIEQNIRYDKSSIVNDFKLSYRVDFVEYTIKLQYNSEMGNPLVNSANETKVKMGDKIEIVPNPSLEKGYMFYQIEYNQASYEAYTYIDEVKFNNDYLNLYVLDNGYVFKNISNIYNDEFSYYTLLDVIATDNNSTFIINSFDAANYVDESGVIVFNVAYIPVEMTIDNISTAIEKLDGNGNKILDALNLENIGLTDEDIATYTISATCAGITRPIVENESIVTINDIVTINIQLNKTAINSLDNSKIYDLSRGLMLETYSLISNWNGLTCENLGGGAYKISFAVSQNINPTFAKEGKISIHYGYQLKNPNTIIATTNMAGSSDFNSKIMLKITGDKTSESENVGLIAQQNTFLTDVKVELLLNSLSDLFVINGITAYKGEMLEKNKITNLNSYFIKPQMKTLAGTDRTVIDYVDLTTLDSDIIIQFNIQPRIYIEGQEITTQPEKIITRTYQFEVKNGSIQGVAQNISLGTDPSRYDIAGYGIDPSIIKVEVWQGGARVANGAINKGEYDLKLVFTDVATDQQKANSWLNYIGELPCKIKLVVEAVVIQMEADITQFDKEYNTSSAYDLNLTQLGTKLMSGDKNITLSGVANAKTFDLGMLSFDSSYTAEIVVYNENDALVSQKFVTNNNYANILITGLKLNKNNNFKLKLQEYPYLTGTNQVEQREGLLIENIVKIVPKVVEIENIEVYDKVYDEMANAKFGLVEGASKYVLKYTFTSDNVYLVPEELKIYFTNSQLKSNQNLVDIIDGSVGANKNIVIDARTALSGDHKENYVIGDLKSGIINYKETKTIYPAKLSTTIKGVGNVTLINKRGLEDHTKAGLIPVGATLNVERIEADSTGYREIASDISSYLSRRNVFAAGYKLSIIDKNGTEIAVNNELHLSVPKESELVNVLSLSGDKSKALDYDTEGGNVIIDLNQIDEEISYVCLIQNRALLQAWQIVLIVILSIITAAGIGVAVFFIIRRRRLRNEKYDTI